MTKAVFAGTFDPATIGHEKVIEKAIRMFDFLFVVICINPNKQPLFSVEKRLKMLNSICNKYTNVKVCYHEGLLVDFMKENDCYINIRGVRNNTDYRYENEMHFINSEFFPQIITIYIPCERQYVHISSSIVKKAIENKKDLHKYLPEQIIEIIKNK